MINSSSLSQYKRTKLSNSFKLILAIKGRLIKALYSQNHGETSGAIYMWAVGDEKNWRASFEDVRKESAKKDKRSHKEV